MTREPIARLTNITKTYGDTVALDDVSVDLFPGEILGLVGANGSGKTTLASILSGNMLPDSGEIWVQGSPVSFGSTADAVACGVRILPQQLELYPSMSILENIFIGQEMTRSFPFLRMMAWAKMREAAKTLLSRVGADSIDPRAVVSRLSGGQQKAVVLARLLARKADVLVFDEPMASLGIRQKARLLEIFASEAADGRSIVFVSHDVEDVLSVCNRVVVLRKGRKTTDIPRNRTDPETLSLEMSLSE